jgi:hypothetical protein
VPANECRDLDGSGPKNIGFPMYQPIKKAGIVQFKSRKCHFFFLQLVQKASDILILDIENLQLLKKKDSLKRVTSV